MLRKAHYARPDWFTTNVFNRIVVVLFLVGFCVLGSRILRVRGRQSGEWRTTPVNLLVLDGQRYLVAPRGQTQWVRNLRVAGTGELMLGSKVEPFRATELPVEARPAILRPYLRRWKMEVGVFFGGVSADSPESELQRIAPDHPVFRLEASA